MGDYVVVPTAMCKNRDRDQAAPEGVDRHRASERSPAPASIVRSLAMLAVIGFRRRVRYTGVAGRVQRRRRADGAAGAAAVRADRAGARPDGERAGHRHHPRSPVLRAGPGVDEGAGTAGRGRRAADGTAAGPRRRFVGIISG